MNIFKYIRASGLMAFLVMLIIALRAEAQQFNISDSFLVLRFEQNNFIFSHWSGNWITVDKSTNLDATEIVIPSTIEYHHRIFPIAELGAGAFQHHHKLKRVTISEHISILAHAFTDCPKLRVVEIKCKQPPRVGDHCFYGGTPDEVFDSYHFLTTAIVVPAGCEQAFRQANGWSSFKTIISHEPTPQDYDIQGMRDEISRLEQELQDMNRQEKELLERIEQIKQITASKQ